MLTPLWIKKDVKRFLEYFGELAEVKIFELLQRTGEEFVKYARENGQYNDQTGNLRSSIGYVIVKDGSIIGQDFALSSKTGTDKATGMQEAKSLSKELALTHNKGFVLIGMAGMKYAAAVEAIDTKDVISMANVEAEEFIKKQSKSIFDRLASYGR